MPEETQPTPQPTIELTLLEAKVLYNVMAMAVRTGLPMGLNELPTVAGVGQSLLSKIEAVEPKPEELKIVPDEA